MNHCFLCGEYGGSETAHDESETHRQNYFKHLKEQNLNRKSLKVEEQINIDRELEKIENYYDSNMVYECGNQYSEIGCEFEGTREEVIEHEKTCLNFKREIFIETPKNDKKTYSDATATCDKCGKIFLHTCKTSLPKHQLTRHLKSCSHDMSKICRTNIRNFLNIANEEQLKKLNEIIKTI